METSPVKAETHKQSLNNYLSFGIKSTILAIIAYVFLTATIDVIADTLNDTARTTSHTIYTTISNGAKAIRDEPGKLFSEGVQIRLKGFFSANPAAHYRLASMYEQKGAISAAILEMELAVGLLEMHSSEKAVLARYLKRLNDLRDKEAGSHS